jgi:pyruvate,orthophosphate dikinase
VPEARTLLGWAAELGIEIGDGTTGEATSAGASAAAGAAPEPRKVTPDRCLQAVAIKGFALPQGVADAVRSSVETVGPILDQLAIDGLVMTSAGAFRPTDTGTARAAELQAADRAAMGADAATAALDDFLALDARMKETVTAWQLRDPAAQVLNDHTDAEYDRGVLDRLAALHADTVAWLVPLEPACARLADYRERLEAANSLAQDGDGRYVASPRVDSYHGIWFELHEDLIQLAGRTREDEAAAGRA